ALVFVGSFILIISLVGKNKNYAVEETIDDILNSKEDEHMNMFNNNNYDAEMDYDRPNGVKSNPVKNIDTNKNNYSNEVQYDEEAEEREAKLNLCNENLKALQDKLNSTMNENTKKVNLWKLSLTDI
ncbi:hypothetical protein PIROE2DRAFT_3182, partial [Piromyces sp. E2]